MAMRGSRHDRRLQSSKNPRATRATRPGFKPETGPNKCGRDDLGLLAGPLKFDQVSPFNGTVDVDEPQSRYAMSSPLQLNYSVLGRKGVFPFDVSDEAISISEVLERISKKFYLDHMTLECWLVCGVTCPRWNRH